MLLIVREAANKNLVAWPLMGGMVNAGLLRKKIFFEARKKIQKNVATKLEGGGVKPKWPGHLKKKLRLPILFNGVSLI